MKFGEVDLERVLSCCVSGKEGPVSFVTHAYSVDCLVVDRDIRHSILMIDSTVSDNPWPRRFLTMEIPSSHGVFDDAFERFVEIQGHVGPWLQLLPFLRGELKMHLENACHAEDGIRIVRSLTKDGCC